MLAVLQCSGLTLHRWPYPNDVLLALQRSGVDIHALRAARPDLPSRAWRAGSAAEVEDRIRFLTAELRKEPSQLAEHPQYLWSQFDRHVMPRAAYAHAMGVLESLSLRQLLGTPDLGDRPTGHCGRQGRRWQGPLHDAALSGQDRAGGP